MTTLLTGGDIVTREAVLPAGTLIVEHGRVARIRPSVPGDRAAAAHRLDGHIVVPGFVDVHVHGVAGVDVLDPHDAVERIASLLPRFGVTAFCPTTMACEPADLHRVLAQVRRARARPDPDRARVLPAHLESNFINPRLRGAQPPGCLRTCAGLSAHGRPVDDMAAAILREIAAAAPDVGIVTLAPEIDGGLALIGWLRERDIRVSLGHSGATFEQAQAAIEAGASQATHLFNCMPPLHHRAPGLAGAVLRSTAMVAELICDGVHVHPAVVAMAIAAKTPARLMAITDGTAAAALPAGASAQLGGRAITARDGAARLDDGTLAGSVLTMDRAFRMLTGRAGCSLVDAVHMCATTPARALGLNGLGVIAEGAVADLAVIDRAGEVAQTYLAGRLVYSRDV